MWIRYRGARGGSPREETVSPIDRSRSTVGYAHEGEYGTASIGRLPGSPLRKMDFCLTSGQVTSGRRAGEFGRKKTPRSSAQPSRTTMEDICKNGKRLVTEMSECHGASLASASSEVEDFGVDLPPKTGLRASSISSVH